MDALNASCVTLPDDLLVRSGYGFHLCGFDYAAGRGECADARRLCATEGKEMNGILIAGAIVAVGLLIYLLVALPGDTGHPVDGPFRPMLTQPFRPAQSTAS